MGKAHRRAVIALGMVLACCVCAFGLDPSLDISQYAHTAWKIRDGFFKGYVSSIAQTPDGYLWLGTEFGLLRFDGVRAVPWQPPENQHVPPGAIFSLFVSRDGTLWIGARGLASWKDGKFTEYPELANQYIFRVLEDREDTVWAGSVGVPTGKLCAIHNGGVHCYGEDGSLGTGVSGLYEDSKGNLWAGAKDGLWRWKPGPPKFYSISGEANGIQAIAEDSDGALLVGRESGIYRFIDGRTEQYSLPGSLSKFRANRILRDRLGALWIGTNGRGVVHIHQKQADVFSRGDGLSADDVTALFEDREGNVWISTLEGLDRFRNFTVTTFTVKQGLSSNVVGSVLADKDESVWLATYAGLNRWDRGRITVPGVAGPKRGEGSNSPHAQSLFQDDHGRLWIPTSRELGYLENSRFIPVRGVPGGQILSIVQDTAGNLWVINEHVGLFRISLPNDIQKIQWSELGHKDHASVLAADRRQGGLWMGFFNGGIAYFSDGQIRASYTAADGLGAGHVSDFQWDADGTLWVSTEGGLSRLKNNRLATLSSKNGLPCDTVHWSVKDDEGSFWLYTACGLVRIERSELEAWAAAVDTQQDSARAIKVTVFDSSDGVKSLAEPGYYHPQVAKTHDGKLWFLPWDGVSVIDPRHLAFNQLPPPVHIEQIIADGKSYDASSGSRLPPLVRDLDIDYTGLSFVAPEKVLFRYKLEGWDRDWQNVGNRRQAFYTNLAPGHYRFRVTACNNSGVWNEAGTFLDFSIAPAYWQTTWFRALCAAVFLALLWAAFRVRIRQIQERERKFREAIETIPAMAFTALPDGSRTFVNRRWVEYTGLTVEHAAGLGWQAVIHPDDLKRVLEKWRVSVATGESMEYEARGRRADGEYRWFLIRAVPMRDKRGNILQWYGLMIDIEDRKRAEEERESLRSDLAHVNRVSMMGELTASLAHEVKQPIAATVFNASACLRWLKRDQPDLDEVREAADRIMRDGKRAGDIIERLQSFYKKSPPKRELVEVNEIVQEMVGLLRGEANRHAVSIRTDLAADLPEITADRVQLQQVLMNLMLNAVEAMKETGGVLTVKSHLDQDGRVLISVSDTGVGLPTEKADQIFNAFFTTKPQGSGMGLAISRSIVESHGGHLWATPNSGRGATFHFTLPIAADALKVSATGT